MLNRVHLIGRLGRPPEIRHMQSGDRVANFALATSERWTDKRSGEKREATEWHRVKVFNESTIGFLERYVEKGALVYVEGKLETRKWSDQSGVDRFTTEIKVGPFDGRIQLLKGNDNAGAPADDYGTAADPSDSVGADPYRSSSSSRPAYGSQNANAAAKAGQAPLGTTMSDYAADLNDDIPF